MSLRRCVHGVATKTDDVLLMLLKLRFSSIEPRSPTSPNGHDPHQIYTVPDIDDNVFTDEKELPKSEVPPTPGTAPSLNAPTSWSKRKLRNRDIILTAIGVILFVALAVGIAVAVIFFNTDSSSSELSSSSTSATSTVMTLPSSQEIHYDGHMNLSSPWKATIVQLEHLFLHDMKGLIAASPLYPSFVKLSLLKINSNEEIYFDIDFKKNALLEAVNATEEITDNSLATTVQTILRNLVVTNTEISLSIKADSIVIFESSLVTTTTATTSTSTSSVLFTTEAETKVQCVPFNFSLCNDIGINETVLPIPEFQCDDIECLIEKFHKLAGHSMENGCTNDYSFFCSYTFRGCNKDSMVDPIGPCFETCIDAVDHCGKFMPHRPDCLKFNRTDIPCISSHPASLITTPFPYNCIDQTYSLCEQEGFKKTYAEMLDEGIREFEKWALPTIETGCSEMAKFFYCGIFLPTCDENTKMRLPCRKYCIDVHTQCPNVTFPVDCADFEDDVQCVHPLLHATPLISTATTSQTSTVITSTSNTRLTSAAPTSTSTTSAATTSASTTSQASPTTSTSTTSPTTTSTSTTSSTPGTTSGSGTTLTPKCEPLPSSYLCAQFGYTQTSFPNLWDSKSAEEANKTYYRLAERSVAAGCSINILFYTCSALFPACEGDGILKLPCTSYCEEVNANCSLLFNQDCAKLSDPNPDRCLTPPSRTPCQSTEFACIHINKCIPLSALCNKQNDCGDWSDERDCKCHPEFESQCAMGLCIPSYFLCDKTVHCPDNSDENECHCEKNQYKCEQNGPCIMTEWLCDGKPDCPENDDEHYCHECGPDEFMCVDRKCVPLSNKCDGTPQCADHSDEMKCILKGGPNAAFFIAYQSDSIQTCSEGFTEVHGETACQKMGQVSLTRLNPVPAGNLAEFFQLDPNGNYSSVFGKGKIVNKCPSDVVALECQPKECGHPNENQPLSIINGNDALPAAWPWMVSIRKYNIHQCGGSIIHPYFILTAGHCVDSSLDYTHMWIVAGTSRLSQLGSFGQQKKVRRAITYPGYRQLNGIDLALLELEEPLTYNDFVKPICFPEKNDVFTKANNCYIAGWGHTQGVQGETSEHLQEVKMTLLDTEKCNSSYMWNGRLTQYEMCAGYFNGLKAACSGDSGSPIVCQDEGETWKSVGVASYVYKTCSVATKPLVYTSTQSHIEWIRSHTVSQFTCGDGIQLFDKAMLCDTVADCKDRSDEIDRCNVSVNCSFSNKFLCGYQSKWQLVVNGGRNSENRFPLFDHTVGNNQGMYLLGKTRGDDVKSPHIELSSPHCMRFHYHMRGKVVQGMAVSVYNMDHEKWMDVWNITETVGVDRWLMGMFDLEPGRFDVIFRPHDNRRFALDDILLIEGKCNDMRCLEGEFKCMTQESVNCLPLAVMCNFVLDCDDTIDEYNCKDRTYICDFENGNICSLEQESHDTMMSEWVMVNSSNTPGNLQDHTFQNNSGTMLKINTEELLKSDHVFMSHYLMLDEIEHCLKFVYASTSPVTLQVTLEWNGGLRNLIEFTDRKTQGWISTQATLPTALQTTETYVKLTYAVIGGELGAGHEEQAILLDDITITTGQCPTFTCPAGSLLCEGEAYCVSESKICDRIIDCNQSTDEITCECTATEYKCPTGPCIPKIQTCDLIKNCPDGSDEGAVCDGKLSVSCDFEDVFLCGYKINTSVPNFHWQRAEGKSGDIYTGPSSDHTFINDGKVTGHYIVVDGQHNGEYTLIESAPFISAGNGLAFYYHARHILAATWMTGQLTLIVTFMRNKTQIQLWTGLPDQQDMWKYMCVELPVGNISISFVAHRGSGYRADIAMDDILLLDTSCDLHLTDTRISGGISSTSTPSQTDTGCPGTERPCRSGMCLKADVFCDQVPDCPDGSDENDCP